MLEAEAYETYCPLLMLIRRDRLPDPGNYCLGSDCMMWRWETIFGSTKSDQEGYCGLAGEP